MEELASIENIMNNFSVSRAILFYTSQLMIKEVIESHDYRRHVLDIMLTNNQI